MYLTKRQLDVTFITVNYNGFDDTCDLIDSVKKCIRQTHYEFIVVDNASQNHEAERLRKKYPFVTVIQAPENLGFAGANNLGIKQAKARYVMLINNDAYLTEDNIQFLIGRMEADPEIAALSPKIRFAADPQLIQYAGYTPLSLITLRNKAIGYGEYDYHQYEHTCRTALLHGAAMLVRKTAIDRVGLMPEDYFLYYEEIDWSTRFIRAGYTLYFDPMCTVFHKESRSTGQDSPLRAYYLTRNRMKYALRFRPWYISPITITYLILVAVLRDVPDTLFIRRRPDLTWAMLKGVAAFLTQR